MVIQLGLILFIYEMSIISMLKLRFKDNLFQKEVNDRQSKFLSILYMSKKDGKSKKKTGLLTTPQSAEEKNEIVKANRVTNQINIPIRQQIAWAKAYKRLMASQSTSSGISKKFRQRNELKEAPEEYYEVDYKNIKPPAVFVDGYNIIGYINSVESRNMALEDARDCLISDLGMLHGATGWQIEVVFDAYQTGGTTQQYIIDDVVVTYTGKDETADNHIERRFEEMRKVGFTQMIVVTDDSALRLAAGSSGVGFLSAAMLLEEFRIAYKGWENTAIDMEKESQRNRPTLADSISDEMKLVIQKLKQEHIQSSQPPDIRNT